MNDFRLVAHGVAFDPVAYLASAPLKVDGVWHKGETSRDQPKSSGVFKMLGDRGTLPIGIEPIYYFRINRAQREPVGDV